MKREDFVKTLAEVREKSPKRKFNQSLDLIVTLRNIDLKKPDNHVDAYLILPHDKGKKISIGAFVQTELAGQAKETCDKVVHFDDFPKFDGDKRMLRKLARAHDFFIAQATVMPQVAKVFGRLLGPLNKMPNPKAGCVVPPSAQLKPLVDRLRKTTRVMIKARPVTQLLVGKEEMKDEELLDNIMTLFDGIVSRLPGGQQNVRSALLKFTMGPAVKVAGVVKAGEEEKPAEKKEEKKAAEKKEEVKEEKKEVKKEEIKPEAPKEEKKPEEKPKEEAKEEKPAEKKEEEEKKSEEVQS